MGRKIALPDGRLAGRTPCGADALRGGRLAGRTPRGADTSWGGLLAGRPPCRSRCDAGFSPRADCLRIRRRQPFGTHVGTAIERAVAPQMHGKRLHEGESVLASHEKRIRTIEPDAFGMKSGVAHRGKFVIEREVSVLLRPLVEVLISALLFDAARNQVGRP